MFRHFSKYLRLSGRLKYLLLEAAFMQYRAWIVLHLYPFKRIPGIFKDRAPNLPSLDQKLLDNIRDSIRYAGHVSLWKNKCLVQSLAGRCMLRRRGIPSKVYLGVTFLAGRKLSAHAWLVAGDVEVVPKNGEWREVFVF